MKSNQQRTRMLLTGASGTVGRELVPRLISQGVELTLVGRDPAALGRLFPGCASIGYEDIAGAGAHHDVLVHLATLNNNAPGTYEDFRAVNVDHTMETYRRSKQAGVPRFVYVSSVHALNPSDTSPYAASKRDAAQQLMTTGDNQVEILFLPAVLGEHLSGSLNGLSRLPRHLRVLALAILTSVKPTVSPDNVVGALLSAVDQERHARAPWIVTNGQLNNLVFIALKRSIDLAFAISVLVLLGWLLIILGLAIRLQSPGPALFRQTRVGRNQRSFTCFKFRTMHVSTPNVGTHEVAPSSVTKLGGFLRRTKLDELPQVFNILLNQMSLVGPRPSLPTQTEVIVARASQGVYVAKPGITGLSQIRGVDMSMPDELAASDADYLKLQSILLEWQIMVQTARGRGGGDKLRAA